MTSPEAGIRLTDILTNAAALADLEGAPTVSSGHLLRAIELLLGTAERAPTAPRSPLGRQGPRASVEPPVRELSQRWFVTLGRDPFAALSPEQLAAFREELIALDDQGASARGDE